MSKYIPAAFMLFFCWKITAGFSQPADLQPTLQLKHIGGAVIPYQNNMPLPGFEKQSRPTISLAGQWRKQRFAADHSITLAKRDSAGMANLLQEAANRFAPDYDDSAWEVMDIPGIENHLNGYEVVPEYYEDGVWYRCRFSTPDSLNDRFARLVFYSVNYVADVWLNGNYQGYHEGGYTPFAFDISSSLRTDTTNVLAVRVDTLPWGSREDIIPYKIVDWFNYTGIIHDVYVEFANPVSIARCDVVPRNMSGQIDARVLLQNTRATAADASVTISVYSADVNAGNIQSEFAGDLAGAAAALSGNTQTNVAIPADSAAIWQTSLTISDPQLWFPKTPNLYILKVTVSESGNVIDQYFTQFGIRVVETESQRVHLNGRPVFFAGVARHEDSPDYGRSIPLPQIYSDLKIARGINANFLRTAHYPNHPYTYLVADRLGFAVMEEIPLWWFDEESAWLIQDQRRIHRQMWREMVFRDYNRPSILLWGTVNECMEVTHRQAFIDSVRTELNSRYPDGRLVTQSAAADRPGPDDPSQAVCDVAGWTMYFGVFYGSDYFQGTLDFLNTVKTNYPGKPVLDTEYGYWSGESGNNAHAQRVCFYQTFQVFEQNAVVNSGGNLNPDGFIMAATWWCIFDWYSAQHPNGFQSMGLYHMDRTTAKEVTPILKNKYLPYFYHGGVLAELVTSQHTAIPEAYELLQNYPNPFNPVTEIEFRLPEAAVVEFSLFNLQGRHIGTLLNGKKTAGIHKIRFDGSDLASGIYFYRMKANGFSRVRKMLLIQ